MPYRSCSMGITMKRKYIKEKTNVMILIPQLNTGGIQKMIIELAAHLDKNQINVLIVSLKPRSGEFFENIADKYQLNVRYLNKKSGVDFSVIPAIYNVIKEFHPDVIHANQRTLTYALWPAVLYGTPKIMYTVHNIADKDAHGIDRRIIKFAHQIFGAQLVAISDLCRKSIAQVYQIEETAIPCIYNGVNVSFFRRPAFIERSINYLAVGRMSPQKNYLLMLKAFATVHKIYPETTLTILGDGEDREKLENFCKINGLSNSVTMPGNVSNVRDYMWRAQAFLMSSDYEGLPVTILEAMSAGMPIVATKAGGIVDIVEDGINGCLIDIGDEKGLTDAMLHIYENEKLRNDFGAKSEILALKYSIDNCADAYLQLYKD